MVTGIVDAVSVLGLGVFTANMKGNVIFLAFAAAGAPGFSVFKPIGSLFGFMVGALIGGRLVSTYSTFRPKWLSIVAIFEAGLLFAAAFFSSWLDTGSVRPPYVAYLLIGLTAMAMGIRTATFRKLAVPDVTTTVLTLTLTSIAADSRLAGGNNQRLLRRIGAVVAMFCGALVGVLLLNFGMALPLTVSGIGVLIATFIHAPKLRVRNVK